MNEMPNASRLAERVRELEQRVERLERHAPAPAAHAAAAPTPAAPRPPRPPVSAPPTAPPPRWEPDGTMLLGLAGALILLAGGAFLVTLAVGEGWVTPHVQVLAALAGGALLALAGLRLHASGPGVTAARARTLAQLLVGVGCALADLGIVAATRLYDERLLEISPPVALVCGALVAAAAGALAVRWRAQALAAFALGTAIAAPLVVDARPDAPATIALVAIALAAAGAVAIARGWQWLPQLALWTSAIEVAAWLERADEGASRPLGALAVVAAAGGWWALCSAGILGFDLRNPRAGLRLSSALGAASAAGLATLAVAIGLDELDASGLDIWLLGFGALHVALGAVLAQRRRDQPAFGIWLLTIAGALLAGGLAERLDGSALTAAWLAEAVALVWLGTAGRDRRAFVAAGLLGGLATTVALTTDADPRALAYGAEHLAPAVTATGAVALALAAAAFLLRRDHRARTALGLGAAGAVLYLASVVLVTLVTGTAVSGVTTDLDQAAQLALSALWVGVGLALLALGWRRRDLLARHAGLAVCALGAAKVSFVDIGTLDAGYRVLTCVIAGAVLLAGAYVLHRMDARSEEAAT